MWFSNNGGRSIVGFIKRWSNDQKQARVKLIGSHIPCPICMSPNGLSVWEGERYLICQYCGAKYQKKQKYVRKRDTIINKETTKNL
jgi:transposase-like protein